MNPKEFPWKADQQVTIKNPTGEDFKFQVNSKWYVVRAGQNARMPGYIAWMYCYKLANRMAIDNKEFIHWNEEGFRKKYYDQLVIAVDDTVQTITPVEPEAETFDGEDLSDGTNPDPSPTDEDLNAEEIDSEEDKQPASGKVKPMRRRTVAKK